MGLYHNGSEGFIAGTGGLLWPGPLLMILFRQKYPRWWFAWNLELQRFGTRVTAYLALMDGTYPSTDDHQAVRLDYIYPDAARDLNRWLPLVKWLLAIPHYIVLFFLEIAAVVMVIVTWFTILFTGRYPRGAFDFVEGVIRWHLRVIAYAGTLVTDQYPAFPVESLSVHDHLDPEHQVACRLAQNRFPGSAARPVASSGWKKIRSRTARRRSPVAGHPARWACQNRCRCGWPSGSGCWQRVSTPTQLASRGPLPPPR